MATKYYAVKVGRTTGIFETWDQCKASVNGYPGALYKSFKTKTEAYNYMGWNGEQMDIFNMNTSGKNQSHDMGSLSRMKQDGIFWITFQNGLQTLEHCLDFIWSGSLKQRGLG